VIENVVECKEKNKQKNMMMMMGQKADQQKSNLNAKEKSPLVDEVNV
jgi:hypothetical protein